MKSITQLHREAMNLAELAFAAKLQGDSEKSKALLKQAFEHEFKAAQLIAKDLSAEPSRAILHRSAATLAVDCGCLREAERLVATGLAGNPPDHIADELRDLFNQINFLRHMDLRGISLEANEFQLAIDGKVVSHGMAQTDEFIERVKYTETLLSRTAQRKAGRPYQEKGRTKKDIKESFELYLSIPRAASFAVTFRIGVPQQQLQLPGFDIQSDIIDEIMECLELFNNLDEVGLKSRISDEKYYNNFIGIAHQLAPDGEDVTVVGFTSLREGSERKVALTKPQDQISITKIGPSTDELQTLTTIEGTLRFADSTNPQKSKIKILDMEGKKHDIIVPEGMMGDIVRPLFDFDVIVTGYKIGKAINLETIKKLNR